MFGTTQLFIFVNPKERDSSKQTYEAYSYEMAMEEMAGSSGFDMKTENKSPGNQTQNMTTANDYIQKKSLVSFSW